MFPADDVRVCKCAKDSPVSISELKLKVSLLGCNRFFECIDLFLHLLIVLSSDVSLNRDRSIFIKTIKQNSSVRLWIGNLQEIDAWHISHIQPRGHIGFIE